MNLCVGLTVCAAAFGCDFAKQETKRFDSDVAFRRVEVMLNVGDVTVRPSSDGKVHVETLLTWSETKPTYVVDGESNPAEPVLKITGRCDGDERCMIDPIIELPPEVELVVAGEKGDISVEGGRGKLTLATEFGDISVVDVGGDLDLRTTSGNIEGRLLNSLNVVADNGGTDGRLDLEFVAAPTWVDGKTVSGDIVYTVPAGGYLVNATSKTGMVEIAVDEATATLHKLNAYSVSGDITIQPPCEASHCN